MRQLLVALLVVPCVLSLLPPGDTWGDVAKPQIYNGEAATNHIFMAHIEIEGKEGKTKQCGGSIYAENVILTSAQCVAPKGRKVGVSTVKILVGVSDWADEEEDYRQEAKAKRIITHQDYKGGAGNDIALIVLENDLQFDDGVGSISPADEGWDENWENTVGVLGWGGTETEEEGTRVLQSIQYSLSDQEQCGEYYKTRGKPLLEGMFCTGGPDDEQHAWAGDEGGPVFITQGDGTSQQVGIVSWGSDRAAGRVYDVNTDVAHFKDWIEERLAGSDDYPSIELQGGLSHGVVLLHQDENSKPGTICQHGAGQNEVNAICKTLGYEYGVTRGSRDYTGRRPSKGFDKMPDFIATDLECDDEAASFSGECDYSEYPDDAEMPCFDGQQLAVQCTNSEWEFEFTHMQTKSGARGKAMCRLVAQQYGAEINVKTEVSAMLVNIKEDGVEVVEQDMKYRRKQTSYMARFKDIDHSCLACVAVIKGAENYFNTYKLEDSDICKLDVAEAEGWISSWLDTYEPEPGRND